MLRATDSSGKTTFSTQSNRGAAELKMIRQNGPGFLGEDVRESRHRF